MPFELVDQIVAYAEGDLKTLKACTLTSSLWHAVSRCYVLREVTITSSDRLRRLERLLHDHPEVSNYVRRIHLKLASNKRLNKANWLPDLAERLSLGLPLLEEIHFTGLWDNGRSYGAESLEYFSRFTNVTRLAFHHCQVPIPWICLLASTFPKVDDLKFSSLNRTQHEIPSEEIPPAQAGLKAIECLSDGWAENASPLDAFFTWAIASNHNATLRSLSLILLPIDLDGAEGFFRAIGPFLEHLEVNFIHHYRHDLPALFSLDHFPQLQSLSLSIPLHEPMSCSHELAVILSKLSSPVFRKLSLAITFGPRILIPSSFRQLIRRLHSSQFASLESLCFVYDGELQTEVAEARLRHAFFKPHQQGILTVTCPCGKGCSVCSDADAMELDVNVQSYVD